MSLYNNAIFCSKLEDVPKDPHWAIVEFTSVMQPGYDKGDPDYSSPVQKYIAFKNKHDWETEIAERTLKKSYQQWIALEIYPARIQVSVRVNTTPVD